MGRVCGSCACSKSNVKSNMDIDLKDKQDDVFKEKMLIIKS